MALPSLQDLKTGGKVLLSRTLSDLEANVNDAGSIRLLSEAWADPHAHVLGITGPPGVGKSTLISALTRVYRERDKAVAVIAVDPSSKMSGGALLGDRTRINTDPEDQGVFVRSMAARDQLGGLASLTLSVMVVMRALYDIVIIETVGVGQSETDISDIADTTLFCVQPGSGDSLQFMKAGIMEVPDLVVVTKGDMSKNARRALSDVQGALGLSVSGDGQENITVQIVSSQNNDGIHDLITNIAAHWDYLQKDARLVQKRHVQDEDGLRRAILDRYGREGLARVAERVNLEPGESPFERQLSLCDNLKWGA